MSSRIQKIIDEFGNNPLGKSPLAKRPLTATPETILAMVMDAMVKSKPISHELSQKTINHLIEAGYHDIDKLHSSTWEERTMVLREGGYNRYREQTATNLGNLAEFVVNEYDGDLNNLLKSAHGQREKTRELIKEIKGIGDLAVELFFDNVQSVWSSIAPFVDSRSLQTAEELGIGADMHAMYSALHQDPKQMSWFVNGLSSVRLEKKQHVIESM
ncbi:hypothetical protein N7509_005971 [Penicillium cosmopolitanum]|uniref:HhH-GPD domain-containing protein n=1 Tax=Penicillium cosmopolitanum TaxID=1131564 RepID=A0A9W9W3J8_9EURO|nr:uncharacterized protein N7509_005971 [Penicillium cosmopolitanum]KAJ5397858.1 hypothetical protein N7509_005971 [Penicillium cosmopolitanum]